MSRPVLLIGASLAAIAAPLLAAETVNLSYDARGRLTAAARSGTVNNGVALNYSHDGAHNRTQAQTTGSTLPAATGATEGADIFHGTHGSDTINGLGGNDYFYVNQGGKDTFLGGAGSDVVNIGGNLDSGDVIDGGADRDQLALSGNYPDLQLNGAISNIESFLMVSSQDNRRGNASGSPDIRFNYRITLANHIVPATAVNPTFDAGQLLAGESLYLDASAETDAALRIFGGDGNDTLIAGAGADLLCGAKGADRLDGRGGADTFWYRAGEWSGDYFDTIVGLDPGADRIDLPTSVSGFASPVGGANLSATSFRNDMAAAVQNVLGASQAVVVTAAAGSLAGRTFLVVSTDGVAGYGTGDLAIELEAPVSTPGNIQIFI